MKKSILSCSLIFLSSFVIYSQLKVFNNGNVSIGTTSSSSSRLYINGNDTKVTAYGSSGTSALFWAVNYNYAYGFGIASNNYGHIYRNINSPTPLITFNTYGSVSIGLYQYSGNYYTLYVAGRAYSSGNWISSDVRLKTNIKNIEFNSIEKLKQLNGKTYNLKSENSSENHYGFIAQEMREVFPELVRETDDSTNLLAINYDGLIPILVESLKEQQKQIEELNNKIAILEKNTLSINDPKTTNNQLNNFPNPFDVLTHINIGIPDNTKKASINIYDSKGILVKQIKIKDRGNTTITFDAKNLSEGVYSYTLVADGKIINSNKMVIQR